MRNALQGRDEITLQPILIWLCKHIIDPRYVTMSVDVGLLILDIYAGEMGQVERIDNLMKQLHGRVRMEVERAQQAWQTQGMLGMLMVGE